MATSELNRPAGLPAARLQLPGRAWIRHRNLLGELVRRDLKSRYRGSNLGVLWSLFNPLLYMIIYSIVFSLFMRVRVVGAPYPVYLLSGLLCYNFLSQALTGSCQSILANASIVTKVAFPWVLLTMSAVLANFVNFLISLLLLVPVLLILKVPMGPSLLLLPVVLAILFMLAMGLGLVVAAANVYFRDVEHLLGIILQLGFFMTPIIYSLSTITDLITGKNGTTSTRAELFYGVIRLNPMTWVVGASQDVLAFHRAPQHWQGLLYAAVLSLVALGVGIRVFNRLQSHFAEEL